VLHIGRHETIGFSKNEINAGLRFIRARMSPHLNAALLALTDEGIE
jgi:hypothetical protein